MEYRLIFNSCTCWLVSFFISFLEYLESWQFVLGIDFRKGKFGRKYGIRGDKQVCIRYFIYFITLRAYHIWQLLT